MDPINNNKKLTHGLYTKIFMQILARKYIPNSLSSEAGKKAETEGGAASV
jgi:hypothetical protein